jgi:hypothetical protein
MTKFQTIRSRIDHCRVWRYAGEAFNKRKARLKTFGLKCTLRWWETPRGYAAIVLRPRRRWTHLTSGAKAMWFYRQGKRYHITVALDYKWGELWRKDKNGWYASMRRYHQLKKFVKTLDGQTIHLRVTDVDYWRNITYIRIPTKPKFPHHILGRLRVDVGGHPYQGGISM